MPRAAASIDPAYLRKHGIEPPKPNRGGGSPSAGKAAEEALYGSLRLLGIDFEPQYPWGTTLRPPRKYVADAAIPAARLLVEVNGRAHIAGYEKYAADMERHRSAVFAGWVTLAFTPEQAKDGTAALEVERYLEERGYE